MKKIFTLAALAIAISASAATKDKYPTTGKLPYWPVTEGKLPKLPAEPKLLRKEFNRMGGLPLFFS